MTAHDDDRACGLKRSHNSNAAQLCSFLCDAFQPVELGRFSNIVPTKSLIVSEYESIYTNTGGVALPQNLTLTRHCLNSGSAPIYKSLSSQRVEAACRVKFLSPKMSVANTPDKATQSASAP